MRDWCRCHAPWSEHNRGEVTPCGKFYICLKGKLYKSYEHMNAVRRQMTEDRFKASVENYLWTIFYSKSCLIDWFAATKSYNINEWGQCPFRKSSRLALFRVLETFDWIIVFQCPPLSSVCHSHKVHREQQWGCIFRRSHYQRWTDSFLPECRWDRQEKQSIRWGIISGWEDYGCED